PAANVEGRAGIDLRPHPAATRGKLGKRRRGIDAGKRGGSFPGGLSLAEHRLAERREVRGFYCECLRRSLGYARSKIREIDAVEPHDARQCLAVRKAAVRPHQWVGVARRNLDMVAKNIVVADLERGDTGCL